MPTTRVEEILKKIHVLFAKGECYQNSPDLIILSKTEMFNLLEELNEAMYEVLDQYEATNRAKEMARLETEREASEIIAEAKRESESVYAGSLVYTDTMLNELNELINSTKDNIRREYIELLAKMDDRMETLEKNREDTKDLLSELHESDLYINVLDEVRKNRENKHSSFSAAASGSLGTTGSGKSSGKDEEQEWPEEEKKPDPVIRVNKPGENTGVTVTKRKDHNKKKGQQQAAANSPAQPMSEEQLSSLSEEERTALEQSTPAYGEGYNASDFNLDAEWEQFKEGQEENSETEQPRKKGFLFFKKKG